LSLTLFEKSPLLQTLTLFDHTSEMVADPNQLFLFAD
jgi:hypothetical protein